MIRARFLSSLPLVVLLAACATDGGGPAEPEGPLEIDGVVVETTTPEEIVASLDAAFEAISAAAYAALLTDDFTYWIRDDNVGDFPWLSGDHWDRDEELGMVTNMFDPDFVGAGLPVVSATITHEIVAEWELLDAQDNVIATEVTVNADITVLISEDDGFRTYTRFVMELVEQENGFLAVQRMQEVQFFDPARRADESTWGEIKALYR